MTKKQEIRIIENNTLTLEDLIIEYKKVSDKKSLLDKKLKELRNKINEQMMVNVKTKNGLPSYEFITGKTCYKCSFIEQTRKSIDFDKLKEKNKRVFDLIHRCYMKEKTNVYFKIFKNKVL